jgi:uncharacterized membrane protein YccC
MTANTDSAVQHPAALPRLRHWFAGVTPALLYGVRLWASVCLALLVSFKLEVEAPYWAATSAAIVCQPSLGASLRKGGFRMIGTLIGAVMIVVMTAAFPQSRTGFLITLALWLGVCGFMASILRNFAGYAAALSGYTAAIIFADSTADPTQTFILAVNRASEICIGIICAGLILAGTDFGTARRRLAAQLASLAEATAEGLRTTLLAEKPDFEALRAQRRTLVLAAAKLDPVIDEAVGEASDLRARSQTLQRAVNGLFAALSGWRNVANHRQVLMERGAIKQPAFGDFVTWDMPDQESIAHTPNAIREGLLAAIRRILRLRVQDPSSSLIADRTAQALLGLCRVLEGQVLLVEPDHAHWRGRGTWPHVPDLLPPILSGIRAVVLMAVMEIFWVVTGWQGGQGAVTFAAVAITLFSPREEEAFTLALGFVEGTLATVAIAAIVQFAVLPGMEGFTPLSGVLAVVLIPLAALSTGTWHKPVFIAMTVNFLPVLAPTNVAVYNPATFFNSALGIAVGTAGAALAMRLLPPLPMRLKIARLHRLTLRDLRRLAAHRVGWRRGAWEGRVYGRILALPAAATDLDSAQLLAALAAGEEVLRLRGLAMRLGLGKPMGILQAALAAGRISVAADALAEMQAALAAGPQDNDKGWIRAAAAASVLAEILVRHGPYLGGTTAGASEAT